MKEIEYIYQDIKNNKCYYIKADVFNEEFIIKELKEINIKDYIKE